MTFVDAVLARDPEALARLRRMRILAAAGDAGAERAFKDTCRRYYAQRHPSEWAETLALTYALRSGDPRAKARLSDLVNLARANDGGSKLRLAMLRAHAPKTAAAPGAPQIGFHPMPSRVRYGVSFGQAPGFPIPLFGNVVLPTIYQVPGFPPVTPEVVMALLALIAQALRSPGGGLDRETYTAPPTEAAPGGLIAAQSYGAPREALAAAPRPTTTGPTMFSPAGRTLVQAAPSTTYSRYLAPKPVSLGYPGLF